MYYSTDIEKLARGDSEPFWKLYDEYYERFLGYALDSLKSTHHAEIVVEEAFEELWDNRQSLQHDLELEYQLFDIIVTRVFEALRCIAKDPAKQVFCWRRIRNIGRNQRGRLTLNKQADFAWKAILNDFLQQQLLHQLATTRR